jgi:hypothetical protein
MRNAEDAHVGAETRHPEKGPTGERSTAVLGDSVPKPLGFIAFPPEWLFLFGATGAAPPFRPLGRRSGRIPALPYPPPRCDQYKSGRAENKTQ